MFLNFLIKIQLILCRLPKGLQLVWFCWVFMNYMCSVLLLVAAAK